MGKSLTRELPKSECRLLGTSLKSNAVKIELTTMPVLRAGLTALSVLGAK